MPTPRLISLAAIAASAAAMLVAAPMASAADSYYLKIDGITGESMIAATPSTIAVKSFELGAKKSTPLTATGGAATKVAFDELTIEKAVDSTTPVLFQKLAAGTALPGMELVVRRGSLNGAGQTVLRYQFQPVYVIAQTQGATAGDDSVTETLVFSYGAMKLGAAKQAAAGTPGPFTYGLWNQVTNAANMIVPGYTDTSTTIRIP